MAVTADKIKVEDIDSREVNEISITKVANDWGIELFPKIKMSFSHIAQTLITMTKI